jgi:serine/threonine-protein kinase
MPDRRPVDTEGTPLEEERWTREVGPALDVGSSEREREPGMAHPTTIGDRYVILGFLGRGGMGSVYRVRDRVLGEVVALKFLRRDLGRQPAMLARFKQEVRVARRVTHPNVARTFDIGTHEHDTFLTMEYIDGEPLSTLLARSGPLPEERVIEIGLAVCAGLEAAHKVDVIHRDLKPDNVLVERTGRVVLTDFGIARAAEGGGPLKTAGIVGTPAYMAPEQVEGRPDLDARVDVYALGALLYELATGARAWPGDVALAVASARLVSPPPDPCAKDPRVPRRLGDLVLRCLARSPADRPPSAAEVAAALSAIAQEASPKAAPPSVVAPAPAALAAPSPLPIAAAPGDKTIAVLPFRNGGAADDDFIAEELTEDLVDMLSTTPGLKVRPFGMVAHKAHGSAGAGADPQSLGRALDVAVVVDGSVRRAAERVRISARLISVAEGFQIWAQRFDRPGRDILVVNDEVARAVAEALTVHLTARPRPVAPDSDAMELYLRARHELRHSSAGVGDLAQAVTFFERGLERAPDDPGMLAGCALARARMLDFARDPEGEPARTRAVVDRAVAVAPHLGEPWLARATLLYLTSDWGGAVGALHAALARAPLLLKARELEGMIEHEIGRVHEGIATLEGVFALDPSSVPIRWELCRAHGLAGHFDRTDRLLAMPVEAAGDRLSQMLARARLELWRGQVRAPIVAPELAAGDGLETRLLRIYGEIARGGATLPAALAAEIEGLFTEARPGSRLRPLLSQCAAEIFAWARDGERALGAIARAVDDQLFDLAWLDHCPVLVPLRADARFQALRARVADLTRPIAQALDSLRARSARPDLPTALEHAVGWGTSSERGAQLAPLAGLGTADERLADLAASTRPSLTYSEKRLALALVVDVGAGDAQAGTMVAGTLDADLARISRVARSFGGTAAKVGASRALVAVDEWGTVADRAAIAATIAREIVRAVDGARVGIAAGLVTTSAQLPAGAVLEPAAALAQRAAAGEVRVDDTVADLLGERFACAGGVLGAPREASTVHRVMGKLVPFVGREKELALLEGIIAEAIDDRAPRAALVLAAPGLGKSRLARELAARLRERGDVRLVEARAEAVTAGATHALLRGAIRSAVGLETGSSDHARVRGYVGELTASAMPAPQAISADRLADFLGELAGAPRADAPGPELASARSDPELMARGIRRTVREWLAAAGARAPLVLVLEDLHWADEATLQHFGEALRVLRGTPLAVVAFARPEAAALLREPWPDLVEVRLGGLRARAAVEVVQAVLGEDADAGAVGRIVERAGGNPLFLEELARFVASGRGHELPASALAVLDARLAELEPDLRRILRAASVLGERAPRDGVAAVAGVSEPEARGALDALVRAEVLERGMDEQEYLFRHALVLDAVHATLRDADRRAAHLRAAEWLERGAQPTPRAMIYHLEAAGEAGRAARWYRLDAEAALEGNDLALVLERTERGIAAGATGVELGRLRLLRAEAHKWRGENQEAARAAAEAMACFALGSTEWLRAAAETAAAAGKVRDFERLAAVAGTLRGVGGSFDPDAARGALARTATQLALAGMVDGADALLARIEALGGAAASTPQTAGYAFEAMAVRGDAYARVRWGEKATECFDLAGDERNACLQRLVVGYGLNELGAYARAVPLLRTALASAERLGLQNAHAVALMQLGHALLGEGALDEARHVEEQALAEARAQKNRFLEGSSLGYLAMISLARGELALAEEHARAGRALLEGVLWMRGMIDATLARVATLHGRPDEAVASAQAALDALSRAGGRAAREGLVRLAAFEAYRAAGREADAREALTTAHSRILSRAAMLDDDLRPAFLEAHPDHARTIALWNALPA